MKVAFLFPGQGVTLEREGRAWRDRSQAVRSLVARAAQHAGLDAERVFDDRRGALPVEVLEPVHTALCLGVHEELVRREIHADVVAGHSLGEVAACAAAGACSPEDAVELAAERGRLMGREAARRPGGMLSVGGVSADEIGAVVAGARAAGVVSIAAHNGPEQWAVSGEWPALRRVAAIRPASPLPVAGAWHTEIMAGALEEFRASCRRVLTPPRIPFVANRTGLAVTPGESLADLLAEQLIQAVKWAETMETLVDLGVTDWITVGPGRVLRGLTRLNLGDRGVFHSTDTMDDLERIVGAAAR